METNIILLLDNRKVEVKSSTFPAGERYIKLGLEDTQSAKLANLFLLNATSDAIIDCILCSNAIKEHFGEEVDIELYAAYFPYSRQDRVCSIGESNSFAVIQRLLKPHFNHISTIDLHNPNAIENQNFVSNLNPLDFPYIGAYDIKEYESIIDAIDSTYTVVVPDKGAIARSIEAASKIGSESIVFFNKERRDGNIYVTPETEDDVVILKNRNKFVIFDDICDGGGTFINIAKIIKEINPNYELTLVVSHGIFSKGLEVLKPYFVEVLVCFTVYNTVRMEHLLSS